MKNFRVFEVKYLGPTDTKGARVRILDTRHNKRVIIDFDYEIDGIYHMASRYLKRECLIPIMGMSETKTGYLLMSDTFDIPIS